jgi:butyrate kinase
MSNSSPTILVINPGSTSTKIAVFRGHKACFETELRHDVQVLSTFEGIDDQVSYRRQAMLRALEKNGFALPDIDLFIGRGGLLRPLTSGVYQVNDSMLADLRSCHYGDHASNLGAILAHEFAHQTHRTALIANPVVVDELSDVARVTGHPDVPRRSIFHALSQKAVAAKAAKRLRKAYDKCNLIVAHLGGGVTIGAHQRGRVIDVNNALDGEGPFSPERTGAVPALPFYRYCHERNMTVAQVQKFIARSGGLLSHLGTNDCRVIEQKVAAGDARHALIYEAFVYQVAKAIGSMAAALSGKVDAIVLTGGVVRGRIFLRELKKMVRFIAPVYAIVKNSEMEALATAALSAHRGEQEVKSYGES